MTARLNNLAASVLRLAGIGSMVACVGAAAAAPRVILAKAAATTDKVAVVAAPAAKPVVPARPAAPATELLHDEAATTAAAVIPPSSSTEVAHRLRVIRMEVTAYCPCQKCCGENAQGITASGHDVSYNRSRFVAADTDLLPFGTKLVIPGYHGGATVEVIDRGGAIKGNKLDLFFPTHEEALQWGRQWLDVTIVE
ncbi:MAG TPA: 3D domain-containing protein [Tepidisphaeraceae bacterium]|jgi:3D (Asp-Asp-Asp) domain-containing protein